MYMRMTDEEIMARIRIYPLAVGGDVLGVPPPQLIAFFAEPTRRGFAELLLDNTVSDEHKQVAVTALGLTLNWTSVKDLIPPANPDRRRHINLITDALNPILDLRMDMNTAALISQFSKNKGVATNDLSRVQAEDVRAQLLAHGNRLTCHISASGAQDHAWHGNGAHARSDGWIRWVGQADEILVYLRAGSSTGGTQRERYTTMVNLAGANHDRRFLFVCDGPEAYLMYNHARKQIEAHGGAKNLTNAIFATARMLDRIDFEHFRLEI
jgi:hypothetical protein